MWQILPNSFLTWTPVRGDGASVHVNTREKEAITALAGTTATHDKLRFFLIAKGKTPSESSKVSCGRQMALFSLGLSLDVPQISCQAPRQSSGSRSDSFNFGLLFNPSFGRDSNICSQPRNHTALHPTWMDGRTNFNPSIAGCSGH
jgi:hypothetical protein